MIRDTIEFKGNSKIVEIIVRHYNGNGKITETVHKLSVNEMEDVKNRLQNICYDEKPIKEILEE